MKKSILILSTLLITTFSFSFATPTDGINGTVINSFKKDFVNAQDVKWEAGKIFIKAVFRLNDQVTYAYYKTTGELVAVTRNILSTQLPINQMIELNNNYKGYWITDLFEVSTDHDNAYYITLENADSKLVLKSIPAAGWEVYKKETKN